MSHLQLPHSPTPPRALIHSMIGDAENGVSYLREAWKNTQSSAIRDSLVEAGERLEDIVHRIQELLKEMA